MSEENKNPLIEAVLKLQEKMVGYGGTKNNDPYQGRSQQRFTAASTTPDALRVKPSAPAAAPKTTPSTSSSAAAPTPKPTGPVVVPTSAPAPSPEISAAETDDKLSRSAPNAAAAYAARKLNTTNATTTDNSVAKKISDTAKSTMDSAKEYADAGAEKLESGVESGKKYVKDKISDFMKWLRSEEYRRDMLDANLQEFYGGTAQDRIPMQQRIRNATGSQLGGFGNREVTTRLPASAPVPPRPTMDSPPKPQAGADNVSNVIKNAAANRSASALGGFGKVAPDAQGTSSFSGMPKTNLGATSPEGFIKRMSGVEKANPIAAPGKLEGGSLKIGSRGDEVKALQKRLGVDADGIFGPKTAEALKKMQQSAGLKADAVYGKQSASYLNRRDALSNLRKENPIGAQKMETGADLKSDLSSGINAYRFGSDVSSSIESGVSPGFSSLKGRASSTSSALDDREAALKAREIANSEYTKREQKFKQGIREDSTTMSNPLIDAFLKLQSSKSSNLFAEAKKAKKLDPVGKEDEDIDNDGDKDKTDSYLHNRRKKIADAMKEATDPNAEGIAKDKQKAPIMVPKPDYPTSKPGPTRELKGSLPKGVTVKGNTNEAVSPMAGQGTSGTTSAKRDLPLVPSARLAGERQATKDYGEPGSRQRSMMDNVRKSAFDAKTPGENVAAFGKALGARVAEPFAKAVDVVKGYETPQSKVVKTGKSSSTVMKNEEVEFSEAELAHIASIVEAVAPTPEDHASNATPENNATGGKGRGSMTEEDAVKRGRGRPKGSKSGSKHGGGGNAAGVTHLVDQIKHAGTRGIADGKGNYMLKHEHGTNKDGSPKVHTAAVPQKAANDFYKSYHNTEKPAAKQDLHDKFVAKHFGISKATSKPGISLASMPRPKS